MSRLFSKSVAHLAASLLLASLAACSKHSALESTAGPFRVSARFEPESPRTGDNTLTLCLSGENGEPVLDARIEAVATMPAMGAMPEMRGPGAVTPLGDGCYRIDLEIAMTGAWPLEISIRAPDGREASLAFDYKTGVPVRLAGSSQASRANAAHEKASGRAAVQVDDRQRQRIGVKTKRLERSQAVAPIRAFGRVVYDESRLTDVALKFPGFVGEVFADATGIAVRAGEPLLTVYSPELLSAQQEYLESLRRGSGGGLAGDARQRLLLWNLSAGQISELARSGRAATYVPIDSPASGTVIEKNVVDGSAFELGERLYRIADLSTVWIEAEAYEADLPLLEKGQSVKITLPYLPGTELAGQVDYVYPAVDPQTRTGRVRLVVPNPELRLKPEMYADVELTVPLGEQLVVPEEAVIRGGKTNVVFLDVGDGWLEPKTVELGRRTPAGWVVLSGLAPGDVVVTSATFLIAAESKLKSGIERW